MIVENKSENCQGKRQAQEAEWESKAVGKTLEGEKLCGRANRSVKGTESWETMLTLKGKLVYKSWKLMGNGILVAGRERYIV